MKLIDLEGMEIVFSGSTWTHNIIPCAKQAIPLLERNEKIVSWLKPQGGGVSEHIPAILYKGNFYSLSLRMQKAIYRHIRLKKGFKNEEVMDGIAKLRIPDVLLKEKIRTQSRFDAMRKNMMMMGKDKANHNNSNNNKDDDEEDNDDENENDDDEDEAVQDSTDDSDKGEDNEMKNSAENKEEEEQNGHKTQIYIKKDKNFFKKGAGNYGHAKSITIHKSPNVILKRKKYGEDADRRRDSSSSRRERVKTTCTVSARMKQVVAQMIACTLDEYTIALQQTTVFAFKSQQSEIITCFLEEMRRENGTLFQNKEALMEYISNVYDHTQQLVMMHQPKATKS